MQTGTLVPATVTMVTINENLNGDKTAYELACANLYHPEVLVRELCNRILYVLNNDEEYRIRFPYQSIDPDCSPLIRRMSNWELITYLDNAHDPLLITLRDELDLNDPEACPVKRGQILLQEYKTKMRRNNVR